MIEACEHLDWAKFNIEMRAKYGHPKCEFCGKLEACFCQKCIVPNSYEQLHKFYCHSCQITFSDAYGYTHCPTCGRKWPADKPARGWQ